MKNISIHPRLPRCNEAGFRSVNLCADPSDKSSATPMLVPAPLRGPFPDTDGGYQSPPRIFPPLTFVAVQGPTFTGTTQARTLSGDADYLHWTGPVAESDLLALRRDLQSMYLHLADTARGRGYYVQPVVVWYRVLDIGGHELYRSMPVVVGPGGFQGLGAISASAQRGLPGSASVEGFKMSVEGFRLGLVVPGVSADDYPDAASVEVMVSPMLNPVSLGFDAELAMKTVGGSSVMQGCLVRSADASVLVPSVIDRLEAVCRTAVRFVRPFAGGIPGSKGAVSVIEVVRSADTATESADLYRSLRTNVRAGDAFVRECVVPHGFSASVASRVGDMMVYGAVTPKYCPPPRISELAVGRTSASAWTALVRVTLAVAGGGEEVLSVSESGATDAPAAISPLVAYPLPNAVRMEIQLTLASTGERRRFDVAMRPTPCGTMSYGADPDMKPLAVESGVLSATPLLPVDAPAGVCREGVLAVASLVEPWRPVSVADICPGRITAVTPAARSSSAWDFARRHLYVFTTAGVYSVAVNTPLTLSSAHLIDSLSVTDAAHVAYSPDGVYFCSEDSLWRVRGSRVEQVMCAFGIKSLTWNHAPGELWCRGEGDEYTVLTDTGRWYTSKAGGVEWSHRFALDGRNPALLRHFRWLMSGSSVSLDISVAADNGVAHESRILSRIHVEGCVRNPIRRIVRSCPFRYLTVSVKGTVSSDFRLGELLLELAEYSD